MKRLISLGALLLSLTGALAAQSLQGKTVYITVKNAQIKESTGFFARVKGTLHYGDAGTVIRERGNWVELRSNTNRSLQGWVSAANVSTRRVVSSSSSTSASTEELALAGKGFSEEVERAYRAEGNLNYDDIDKMEAPVVSTSELSNFITDGHLAGGE